MIRIADYIIDQLSIVGMQHIFMVTGRGALFLSDAVAAHKKVKGVSMHHEQSTAFAAITHSQLTGKLGACLVSTGCASTNTITGVLNAWQDGIPCIFISGQNKLNETTRYTGIPLRTYGQQEADIVSLVEPITKYAVMITDPKRIRYEVEKAFYFANNGRKGPVWIDVPLDVQNMRVDVEELEGFDIESEGFSLPVLKQEDLEHLKSELIKAERPVVIIGSGIRSADALEELKNFIEKSSIPLTYATSAPDIYGSSNPLSIGSVGSMGCSRAGSFAVQNADLVLVLGNRLLSMTTGTEFKKFAREAKVIVVDIDPVEHSKKSVKIDHLIEADVKQVLKSLLNENLNKTYVPWSEKCQHWKELFPICEETYKSVKKVDLYQLAENLTEVLPDESVYISDSGLIDLILPPNIRFKEGQHCIHPASQGSMGFALPAIVGAYHSCKLPIIAVVGDGSIMMNLQELETIRYQKIPAKIFVINNNAYAVIRRRQKELFRSRTIGTDPGNGVGCPDFSKVANCFGFKHVMIENSTDLMNKLKLVIDTDGPVLCEIMGKDDQGYIAMSHARNVDKRFVLRPLEDQAPYLDRELFLDEMIVSPIDQ
jgi:acetolactate synthase I/II/III large subunit